MGVKGLTYFIETLNVLQHVDLHTIDRVIIDGSGLKYHLYAQVIKESECSQICGGEYKSFEDNICKFFGFLKRSEVNAFVVFDGADDLDGKKLEELHRRREQTIKKVDNVVNNTGIDKGIDIVPLLAHGLFLQTLRDLNVPFAFTNFEADNEIAGLANQWGCPVMAGDSDFYIFDNEAGYIPFWYLDVEKQSARMYKLSRFCNELNIKKEHMTVLAALAGNDYVTSDSLEDFFNRIHLKTKNLLAKLRHILRWLSNQKSMELSLRCIYRFVSKKVRSNIEVSMRMYELSCESQLAKYFTDQFSSCQGLKGTNITQSLWCVNLIRNGMLPAYFITIMTSYRLPTVTQVEDHDLPSSHHISKRLRQILYGVLLDDDNHLVEELEREGRALSVIHVKPVYLEEIPHVPLRRMLDVHTTSKSVREIKSEREDIILAALQVNFHRDMLYDNDIPPCFHLQVCAIIYWLSWNGEAKVTGPTNILDALLLYWINETAKRFLHSEQHPGSKHVFGAAFEKLLRWTPEEVLSVSEFFEQEMVTQALTPCDIDKNVMHSLAEMQSVMVFAMDLNSAFLHPFPQPNVAVLYSGMWVHRMHGILRANSQEWVEQAFQQSKQVKKLYLNMRKVILDNIPSDRLKSLTDAGRVC